MADNKRILRDFAEGERAALADQPRSTCSIQPSSSERFDAWNAGFEWGRRADGPFTVLRAKAGEGSL